MAAVGKKLRVARGEDGVSLLHWCPACKGPHSIRIEGRPPTWSFNGDFDAPSFSPSVLCFTVYNEHDEGDVPKRLPAGQRRTLCHYFIRQGIELVDRGANLQPRRSYIDFCGDCPHELRGKIVELPDWPYPPGAFGGIEE